MPTIEITDDEFIFYIAKKIQRRLGLIQKYHIDKMYTSAIQECDIVFNELGLLKNSLERLREKATKQLKIKEEKTK